MKTVINGTIGIILKFDSTIKLMISFAILLGEKFDVIRYFLKIQ